TAQIDSTKTLVRGWSRARSIRGSGTFAKYSRIDAADISSSVRTPLRVAMARRASRDHFPEQALFPRPFLTDRNDPAFNAMTLGRILFRKWVVLEHGRSSLSAQDARRSVASMSLKAGAVLWVYQGSAGRCAYRDRCPV